MAQEKGSHTSLLMTTGLGKTGSFIFSGESLANIKSVSLHRKFSSPFPLLSSSSLFFSLLWRFPYFFFFWWQYCSTEIKPFLPPSLCFLKTPKSDTNVFYLQKPTCIRVWNLHLREIPWKPVKSLCFFFLPYFLFNNNMVIIYIYIYIFPI